MLGRGACLSFFIPVSDNRLLLALPKRTQMTQPSPWRPISQQRPASLSCCWQDFPES